MATFKRFPDLPMELRDEIWKFVIRPTGPGVHIFRLYHSGLDDATGAHYVAHLYYFHEHHLAVPLWNRYFDNIDTNCSDKNVSTYLIDGGLWTACKESRMIMEDHFQTSEWKSRRKYDTMVPIGPGPPKALYKPATFYFSGKAHHYFTVLPHRDLFVLQADNLKSIDWTDWDYEISFGSPRKGFSGLCNIALEYDDKWGIQLLEAGRGGKTSILRILTRLAYGLVRAHKIWLIDHNLKRKKDAPVFKENAKWYDTNVYYTSDRRFLDVQCHRRPSGYLNQWEYIRPVVDGYSHGSSIWFMGELREEIESAYNPDDSDAETPCEIGLLGWDNLS
ncbi:hypothetical protein NW762_005575 [Fusarium torreyae]|uniref:2EXR domain-containing protein n=1 Tax=Fusarium torreyae TaxID=1237075 RepID=A0A9W8S5F0_9HYPO|nr:hypothetical protein NW762_005575 [Fusarium torreyae]